MSELDELAAALVAISSPSRKEGQVADLVERRLEKAAHLEVSRVGDNVVARTQLGRERRVIVAGHTDTVSSGAVAQATVVGRRLTGLGAADMKGTLAAMVLLAEELDAPACDLTWVFYAREEVARSESGLLEILGEAPELLEGDVALLGEPTGGIVEAGCQGTLRLRISVLGAPAHTARPYMGLNAIHRAVPVLEALAAAPQREVGIDGVTFAEQLQVVGIAGGTAANVVPDEVVITVNHRFAPDRDGAEAEAYVRSLVDELLDASLGDAVEVVDVADGALPALSDPLLASLVERCGGRVAAKVGWTDVATFAGHGVPAANFGAGDPLLAHHRDEAVDLDELEAVRSTLADLLREGS